MGTRTMRGVQRGHVHELLSRDGRGVPCARLFFTVVICGVGYGAVMGSFGGKADGALYSALKLPILLTGSFLICLPNFYVVNALLGLRSDFAAAMRGVASAQGTLALALVSLAPVTAFFYLGEMGYPTALLLNAAAFCFAALAAQRVLGMHYAPLIKARPRHRSALRAWLVLYVFVTIKLGWILRPFIGDPALETRFLRAEAFEENPYVTLFWTLVGFGATIIRQVAGA